MAPDVAILKNTTEALVINVTLSELMQILHTQLLKERINYHKILGISFALL